MTTPSPVAIEARGLVKCFDETRAVDGVDLGREQRVRPGDRFPR
jgi:hypothetical protein